MSSVIPQDKNVGCVDEVQWFKMYIFFQNNQYLGSYYLTRSADDPVFSCSPQSSGSPLYRDGDHKPPAHADGCGMLRELHSLQL